MKATWKPWALASRPKTLTAALIPVLVGTALARNIAGLEISLYALVAAFFIQIGTNLVNDALDFQRGADTEERLGPVRVTQSGYLTAEQVLAGGMMCFGAAMLFSIPLILAGGWPIAIVMAVSVLCGYLYTGGPFPLAYIGLGDLFVLTFFGFVATGAVYYLQTGVVSLAALVAGAQVGLLSVSMIAVNNLRDVQSDAKAHKRTLPVRFGVGFGRCEITCVALSPFLLSVYWFLNGYELAGLLPFLSLPVAVRVVRGVWKHVPGPSYNGILGLAALQHVLFGILLSGGLWLT